MFRYLSEKSDYARTVLRASVTGDPKWKEPKRATGAGVSCLYIHLMCIFIVYLCSAVVLSSPKGQTADDILQLG